MKPASIVTKVRTNALVERRRNRALAAGRPAQTTARAATKVPTRTQMCKTKLADDESDAAGTAGTGPQRA